MKIVPQSKRKRSYLPGVVAILIGRRPSATPVSLWNIIVNQHGYVVKMRITGAALVSVFVSVLIVDYEMLPFARNLELDEYRQLIAAVAGLICIFGYFQNTRMRQKTLDYVEWHEFELCTTCGYLMVGLCSGGQESTCPECGAPFTKEDAREFWQEMLC